MPRDEPNPLPKSRKRNPDIDDAIQVHGSPDSFQLVVINSENIDDAFEKAQGLTESLARRSRANLRQSDGGEDETLAGDYVAPNGNCPSCTTNGLC